MKDKFAFLGFYFLCVSSSPAWTQTGDESDFSPETIETLKRSVFRQEGGGGGSGVAVQISANEIAALTASHNILVKTPQKDGVFPSVTFKDRGSYPDLNYRSFSGNGGMGFALFVPSFSTDEYVNGRKTRILPKNDFAVIKLEGTYESLPALKIGTVSAEDTVVAIGYPRGTAVAIEGLVAPDSIGQEWIEETIKHDPTNPPFDPEVEILVATDELAKGGMSGGGVFNRKGELIGITVRSGRHIADQEYYYIRVVRMTYIAKAYESFLSLLDQAPGQNSRYTSDIELCRRIIRRLGDRGL